MGTLFLTLIVVFTGAVTIVRPWVGVTAYYFLAVFGPQYIWWFPFEGNRVSVVVALSTFIGTLLGVFNNNFDFKYLINKFNFIILTLWFFISVSYWFGPYVSTISSGGLSVEQIFSYTNKMLLFYFVATLVVNDLKKIRYLIIIFVVTTIFMIYWANQQYFMQNWAQFNFGRLMGPFNPLGGNLYKDENVFAMLFVTGLPFVYFAGLESNHKLFRYFLLSHIPLGLHAIFLTGSRGGLLGFLIITIISILFGKRKFLAIPFLILLLGFYYWQAGEVMTQRSGQITDYRDENSATDRLIAWKGGALMVMSHPLTGVGLGSFVTALPKFIDHRPMVAHNTFIQFSAESGIGAGLCYLFIIYTFFKNFFNVQVWCRENKDHVDLTKISFYNSASVASFSGLVVCSIFLSLSLYEVFFLLLIINNSLVNICSTYNKNP